MEVLDPRLGRSWEMGRSESDCWTVEIRFEDAQTLAKSRHSVSVVWWKLHRLRFEGEIQREKIN